MLIDRTVYDLIGVGIGPFNLGLAVLTEEQPALRCLFFDQQEAFAWHSGLLLPNARLQVPFYADLVTAVNPCSRFTYLNYLKETGRLFRFAIHENNFITRREYNAYCQWVVHGLDCLHFSHKVVDVHYEAKEDLFTVAVHNLRTDSLLFYFARHLVIGVGSVPVVPACLESLDSETVLHSGSYLFRKDSLLQRERITVIGSGQSAAEVFQDLLSYADQLKELRWFTRSARFYPMEYSKLSLEMTSPDYIDHFYSLSPLMKKAVLKTQSPLYRGINFSLINEIYDTLYLRGLFEDSSHIHLHTNCSLEDATVHGNAVDLRFYHRELERYFEHRTEAVVMATGYQATPPKFLESVTGEIRLTEEQTYAVAADYSIDAFGGRIFVQNAELHTHGFSAPDLGMGPYRNAVILNRILGTEAYHLEKQVCFQRFGLP